ncbi:hypothetical protein AOLI_G00290350 [Acnodon oligacanthus]
MHLFIQHLGPLGETAEAGEGGSVILPCSHGGEVPKSEEWKFSRRYNDVKKVYNIVRGKLSKDQDASYRNRTESFPDEYPKGNFSIKLSKVRAPDQGAAVLLHVVRRDHPEDAASSYSYRLNVTSAVRSTLRAMSRRCVITCMLVLLMNEVTLEETVEAVEGHNVLLPCLYSGHIPKSEEVDVAWRYNDVKNVHDITEGRVYADDQDPAFKNRTESFPDAYGKGNFSILLSRVSGSDNGTYSCLLTFASDNRYIKLQVKAPPPTPEPTPALKNESMESRSVRILLIFTIVLGYNLVLF